ncbi:MAG: rhodanese-like domain-containing protein [Gemmatimonadaceae bacterium]|jgi:rhodanese-related sulfurtransferase|nr:rhodanese-like domain-containing protein [Gemmatimonadaceae bacterium]
MKTAAQLIAEAKGRIREVSVADVQAHSASGAPFVLIDVREGSEWQMGHIPGAIHLSRGTLEGAIEARVPREADVVLYCASGNRSALSAASLQEMGYANVSSMAGGIKAWVAAGAPLED